MSSASAGVFSRLCAFLLKGRRCLRHAPPSQSSVHGEDQQTSPTPNDNLFYWDEEGMIRPFKKDDLRH